MYHLRGLTYGRAEDHGHVTFSSLRQIPTEVLDSVFFVGFLIFFFICFKNLEEEVCARPCPEKASEKLAASALVVCKLLR